MSDALDLVTMINIDNLGDIFNLCLLLKVEGEAGWREKAQEALPHLFMVSINGADGGDTQQMGWDRLIRPLGEGTFDTYELVKLLKDEGYKGKFGLQCYNIPQDCETALSQSMNTWKHYQERYAAE
jgi:sugar phosphate isomerase/epimerase